jgi:hypothetical protein
VLSSRSFNGWKGLGVLHKNQQMFCGFVKNRGYRESRSRTSGNVLSADIADSAGIGRTRIAERPAASRRGGETLKRDPPDDRATACLPFSTTPAPSHSFPFPGVHGVLISDAGADGDVGVVGVCNVGVLKTSCLLSPVSCILIVRDGMERSTRQKFPHLDSQ